MVVYVQGFLTSAILSMPATLILHALGWLILLPADALLGLRAVDLKPSLNRFLFGPDGFGLFILAHVATGFAFWFLLVPRLGRWAWSCWRSRRAQRRATSPP
jgi:hypothetical protein